MKESQVGHENVVEVDLRVGPGDVQFVLPRKTFVLVVDDRDVDRVAVDVDTRLVPAAEQVDAHDAEDEPEDETDEQHVEDGRDGLDEGVHHHLHQHR